MTQKLSGRLDVLETEVKHLGLKHRAANGAGPVEPHP